MRVTQISDALPGEALIGIEPELLQNVDAGWLQRLALFTGRTLSDTALTNEQGYRAGRLDVLGQAVTQGIVHGLDLSVDRSAQDPVVLVTPGYGIAATGQDVALLRAMRTTLGSLAVIDGQSGAYLADFNAFAAPGQPWAGVLLLQAIVADAPGSAVDTGAASMIVSGNLDASCDQDPAESAFGDSQIVDGARLVLATWPSAPAALALPPATPQASWRNRLAYTVFNAELALAADERLPWDLLGVPLALAAFGAGSKQLLFVDRSAVARSGGLPRRRYLLAAPVADQGFVAAQPALANARVSQFEGQLGDDLTPTSLPGLIAGELAFLPPCGLLPSYAMDFVNGVATWAPPSWSVRVAPIVAAELDGMLQASIAAAPLDTTQKESVDVLIPLPDEVYDPNVLATEVVNAAFQQEVDAATLARNIVLQHRARIQGETNGLAVALNRPAIDLDAGLTADEIAVRKRTDVYLADPAESFGTVPDGDHYDSTDLQGLKSAAGKAPFVMGSANLPLFNKDDWDDLDANGLQHFIDRINAKLDKANDLLDLAFLTTQTDIYRFRQNVLGTTDATRLAVSPILANIATGVTAVATAQNIRDYLKSIAPARAPTPTPAGPAPAAAAVVGVTPAAAAVVGVAPAAAAVVGVTPVAAAAVGVRPVTAALKMSLPTRGTSGAVSSGIQEEKAVLGLGVREETTGVQVATGTFTPISFGTADQPAQPDDITQQSPIVGAQLDLRTLTIAERLASPPSQEALFYSVANRTALLDLLTTLEITIDDLPIAADNVPVGTPAPTVADLRDATRRDALYKLINAPLVAAQQNSNPDESGLFASGVHVLGQHTQLLRLIEARIQTYRNFLALCTAAVKRIQANFAAALTLLTQLDNDLTQARQNLAFVLALLGDEQARVAQVNATRANVLQTYVRFVAYRRPRTAGSAADTPSRQLLPADVASPVPACLQQSVAVPPELREMVALLREAPISWFPPILSQIGRLERPGLLMDLAASTAARAALQLQAPPRTSSAAFAPGLYASTISGIYSARRATFRTLQTQRAAFQPAQLVGQSWSAQVSVLRDVVAVADLLASEAVHAEVVNATSQSLQQISGVATCLYTRVGQAAPVARLAWAEFLRGTGAGVGLSSLAVLPGWNSQDYVDRQQMQLLVDWLFQQVDPANQVAFALMSDVVAVAILLASHAPVDNIIAGAVALQTKPVVGIPIRLTLPSDRVAHGMYVHLYSAGTLAARAVVSDLDDSGVTASITDVYNANVVLNANDVAHFTAQDPNAVVYKAFSA